MTQQEITEGNKLIAIFMGGGERDPGSPIWYLKEKDFHLFPKEMMYHSSWDWLVPVISKIAKQNRNVMPWGIAPSLINLDLTSVWEGVVSYIKINKK
jgi:hypothetical protein